MANPVLYHNPRCSKSRATKILLESENFSFEIVEYLKNPLSLAQLKHIAQALGLSARELFRQKDAGYKELGLEDKTLSEKALIKALHDNPHLMTRPILVIGDKAAIGRPPENVLEIL